MTCDDYVVYIDTDSEQKSTVREECISLSVSGYNGDFSRGGCWLQLARTFGSIVKQFKDLYSVEGHAFIMTVGFLSSNLGSDEFERDGAFWCL